MLTGNSFDGRLPPANEVVTTDFRQSCSAVASVRFRAAAP